MTTGISKSCTRGSDKGQIVLDPFCGSGTTILAAERLGRKWIASDTSQQAVSITNKRLIQEFEQAQPTKFTAGDADSLREFPVKSSAFRRVAVGVEGIVSNGEPEFILNHQVAVEETRHFEFKEIKTAAGAVDSIVNTSDEYAVAFLNSEGGKIYWGIRDKDRTVVGVHLPYQERDRLRREVTSKLNQIEPRVDPSKYRIHLHQVRDEHGQNVQDTRSWYLHRIRQNHTTPGAGTLG
jgi:SAM-dependent methyltransferase